MIPQFIFIILLIQIFKLLSARELQVYKRVDEENFANASWSNNSVFQCNGADIEFNIANLGQYKLEYQKTVNNFKVMNLPPHYQVNFRIDIYIIKSWDNESFTVNGGSQVKTFYSISYDHTKAKIKMNTPCYGDQPINYFYRSEYTTDDANNQFPLSFKTNCDRFNILGGGCEGLSNESAAIGQVQIFLNTCHYSCLSCTGPDQNQCKSCFNGILPTSGVCPQCSGSNDTFNDGSCVSTCPPGRVKSDRVCVTTKCQFKCQTCSNNSIDCQQCESNYYLWKGRCLPSCPLYYDEHNNNCVDKLRSLPNGFVALEGLQNLRFSSIQIKQLGFSMQNMDSSTNNGFLFSYNTLYTICGDVQLFGGFKSGIYKTKMLINVPVLTTHKFKKVGFKFYLIDYAQGTPVPNISITINGIIIQLVDPKYVLNTSLNLCGMSNNDAYGEFKYEVSDSSTNLSLTIDNQSNFDIGIRDFVVAGYTCAINCIDCEAETPQICKECSSGYFLNGTLCTNQCPIGQYGDSIQKKCIQCNMNFSDCEECNSNKCTKCQIPSHLSSSNTCVFCQTTPIKEYWNPITLSCTNNCGIDLVPNDTYQICKSQCNNELCLTCDSTTKLICLTCLPGDYLYNGTCVKQCPDGTSPDSTGLECQSCANPLCKSCIFVGITPVCTNCINNYFLETDGQCYGCHETCQNCTGSLYNQCTKCNSSDPNIVLNNDNTCTCLSAYYIFDSPSKICQPICGDKYKTPEEQCETFDSKFDNNSGCDSNCKIVSGYKCYQQTPYPLDICIKNTCGNGVKDPLEDCDDGNNKNGDGCQLDCRFETGFNCTLDNGKSVCSAICGDGLVAKGEECDSNDIGCDQVTCKIKNNSGCTYTTISDNLKSSTCFTCSDPLCMKCSRDINNTPVEQCMQCQDSYFYDTVANMCKQCDQSCQTCFGSLPNQCKSCYNQVDSRVILEVSTNTCLCNSEYYNYDSINHKCLPICNDKFKTQEEECEIDDPTKFDNAAGCINCKIQNGYECLSLPQFNLDVCRKQTCGDGLRDSDEECDDGNLDNNDSCSINCKVQQGYICSQEIGKNNLNCNSNCGDKIKSNDEECDSPDAGCTLDCKIKENYGCQLELNYSTGQFVQRCFQCQDSNCQRCEKEYNPQTSLFDEKCVKCMEGFYLNISTKMCEACDPACKTCNGPSSNNCTGCFNNNYITFDSIQKICTCVNNHYLYDVSSKKCLPICGDKFKTPEEDCEVDDPNLFDNSKGCIQCKIQNGYKCIQLNDYKLDICMLSSCQDGRLDPGEQCDDGNQIQKDSCSLNCKINLGYDCTQTPNQTNLKCKEKCGDKIKTPNEECDSNDIGCSFICTILPGYGCKEILSSQPLLNYGTSQCFKCTSPNCKQCQIINDQEECLICNDNSFRNPLTNNCDICHSSCSSCSGPLPSDCLSCRNDKSIIFINGMCKKCDRSLDLVYNQQSQECEELCGKGYMLTEYQLQLYGINQRIECDDGNIQNNDGCSSKCQVEEGYKCINSQKSKKLHFSYFPFLIKLVEVQINLNKQPSQCTTLNDGPIPSLYLSGQITRKSGEYEIEGLISFDREVSISSLQNIIPSLDLQGSSDYEITIMSEEVVLNTLKKQDIRIIVKIFQAYNNIHCFVKFNQIDITDKYKSLLQKNLVSSKLPELQAVSQDLYGNNTIPISVLNVLFGCLTFTMFLFAPFALIVSLFDILQSVNYLLFLNVNYPKSLYVFLKIFNFANFEFFPNISSDNANVPQTFKREQIDSFLFNNICQTIIIWGLAFFIYLISYMYKKFNIKLKNFVDDLMRDIYNKFFYKIVTGIIILTFYEITLSLQLQLRAVSYESSSKAIIGSLFSVLFLSTQFILVLFGIKKLQLSEKIQQQKILVIASKLQSKFQEFALSSFTKKFYFFNGMILMRKMAYIYLIVFHQDNRINQIILCQVIFGIETLLILVKKPFPSQQQNKIQLISRFCFLLAGFSINWLAFDDILMKFSVDVREFFSAICIISISTIYIAIGVHIFKIFKAKLLQLNSSLPLTDYKSNNLSIIKKF